MILVCDGFFVRANIFSDINFDRRCPCILLMEVVFINPLTLQPPIPIISAFSFFYLHIKYHIFTILKIKRDINQRGLKIVTLHFVKSE